MVRFPVVLSPTNMAKEKDISNYVYKVDILCMRTTGYLHKMKWRKAAL